MERRRSVRRRPGEGEPDARVRLRTGSELAVVDISDLGAQVEGPARLLPGTRVDIHVIARDGRVLMRSRVVHAFVCALRADGIRYRAGVVFDRPIDSAPFGYPVPSPLDQQPEQPGTAYPATDDRAAIS